MKEHDIDLEPEDGYDNFEHNFLCDKSNDGTENIENVSTSVSSVNVRHSITESCFIDAKNKINIKNNKLNKDEPPDKIIIKIKKDSSCTNNLQNKPIAKNISPCKLPININQKILRLESPRNITSKGILSSTYTRELKSPNKNTVKECQVDQNEIEDKPKTILPIGTKFE